MSTPPEATPPATWGSWEDAEALRRWAFLQRTPEQRLQWLIEMLEIAYASGARRRPGPPDAGTDPPAPDNRCTHFRLAAAPPAASPSGCHEPYS